MSDPYWFDYPQDWIDKTGPRNLTHCWSSDTDDPTTMPRWGKVGKQKVEDEGPLAPFPNMTGLQNWQEGNKAKYDMETFDEVLVGHTNGAMDKAKKDGKPFFILAHPTRMHVFTYLPPKYQAVMNSKTGYNLEEAGMAQMDDSIGGILQHPGRYRRSPEHHRHFHYRQRRRSIHMAGWRHALLSVLRKAPFSRVGSECLPSSAGPDT